MVLWILLGLVALFAILCVVFRDLLYAAVSLASASVVLAMVLFRYGANVAAVFELSVCAGLITVLFVSTVSLTKNSDQKAESKVPLYALPFVLLLLAGLDVFIIQALAGALAPSAASPAVPAAGVTFQQVFWGQRSGDILGQISLILVGVFGILTLFRVTGKETHHD
jgi:NADH-quinone oxidoreductase subunit J